MIVMIIIIMIEMIVVEIIVIPIMIKIMTTIITLRRGCNGNDDNNKHEKR